jgi:phosphoribosylformylglycinamidine cyclo-ligase
VLDLLRSDVPVHGLAHITGDGVLNLLRLGSGVGFEIDSPLPVPPVFDLIADQGEVAPADMWRTFNMGCGFVCVVPADRAADAIARLSDHRGARIGTVTDAAGRLSLPTLALSGDETGLR